MTNKILIFVSSIFIISLVVLILVLQKYQNDRTKKNFNTDIIIEDIDDTHREIPTQINKQLVKEVVEWKEYAYAYEHIIPNFKLEHPAGWEENFCDAGGCFDINLNKNSKTFQIDLSGQPEGTTFEDSLNDWVNTFGSYNKEYSFIIKEEGLNSNGDEFVIYNVNEDENYIFAIIKLNQLSGSNKHLAIRTNVLEQEGLDLIKHSINSVKYLNLFN